MTRPIRVGGVPEHFNLPWHLAVESGSFAAAGLAVDFHEYPTGTGALCADLRAERLDMVVALTEGLLLDIVKQRETVLLAPYVLSSLCWGIHVATDSPYHLASELKQTQFAVSREGSGSHLMARLWEQQQGWPLESLSLQAVGGLQALEEAVSSGAQSAFLWEKFTTLPRVKAGALRCIDYIHTPWPCFMIAVRPGWLAENRDAVTQLLEVLFAQTAQAMAQSAETIAAVSARYHLSEAEAQDWFSTVKWATAPSLSLPDITQTLKTLDSLGLIDLRQTPITAQAVMASGSVALAV